MQNAINNLKENNLKRLAEIVVKYQKFNTFRIYKEVLKIESLALGKSTLNKHADKYRHILQEIKEIAETHTELCKDCDDQREDVECQELCNGYKLKQILDIIYKAEEE